MKFSAVQTVLMTISLIVGIVAIGAIVSDYTGFISLQCKLKGFLVVIDGTESQ